MALSKKADRKYESRRKFTTQAIMHAYMYR